MYFRKQQQYSSVWNNRIYDWKTFFFPLFATTGVEVPRAEEKILPLYFALENKSQKEDKAYTLLFYEKFKLHRQAPFSTMHCALRSFMWLLA